MLIHRTKSGRLAKRRISPPVDPSLFTVQVQEGPDDPRPLRVKVRGREHRVPYLHGQIHLIFGQVESTDRGMDPQMIGRWILSIDGYATAPGDTSTTPGMRFITLRWGPEVRAALRPE